MNNYWTKPIGYTYDSPCHFSFLWKIESLHKTCVNKVFRIQSPIFLDSCLGNKYTLELYGKNTDAVFLSLNIDNKYKFFSEFFYEFIILDRKSTELYKKEGSNDCRKTDIHFIEKSKLFDTTSNFVSNETLIIRCNIATATDKNQNDVINNTFEFDMYKHKSEVCDNLENFRKNKTLADVTLVVGENKLDAHKFILASRSPVFLDMFDNDVRENQVNTVEIKDFNTEVVEEMLYFIYTGKVKNIDKVSHDLLRCADKYAILGLREACTELLGSMLSIDNVIDTFVLASLHQCDVLKNKIYHFVAANKTVFDSSKYEELSKSQPNLENELLFEVYNKNCEKSTKCSSIYPKCFSFIWILEHLCEDTMYSKKDRIINSPKFFDSHHKCKWSLALDINSMTKLTLVLEDYKQETSTDSTKCSTFLCEFIILDKKYNELFKKIDFFVHRVSMHSSRSQFDFIEKSHLFNAASNFVTDESLIICCNVSIENENYMIESNDPDLEICKYQSKVCDNLENLRRNEQLTDITITTGGEKFEAHKVVLASKSPVFLAMFLSDMRENKENILEIKDFNETVIEEMLYFMYTGQVKNIDKVPYDLLSCADKYSILGLKEICEQFLNSTLTTDNFIDVLLFADLHKCNALKTKVCYFISTHETVLETIKFKEFSKSHPALANVALRKVLTSFVPKAQISNSTITNEFSFPLRLITLAEIRNATGRLSVHHVNPFA